jgi:CRISPR-associated protein Cmr6
MFGTQEHAGSCVFFDAVVSDLPPEGTLFNPEVMTPHFRSYYEAGGRENAAPHDADNPNPITFLTVSIGTCFGFAVGSRHDTDPDGVLRKKARQLLKESLTTYGIGAKTSAGYGLFQEIKR